MLACPPLSPSSSSPQHGATNLEPMQEGVEVHQPLVDLLGRRGWDGEPLVNQGGETEAHWHHREGAGSLPHPIPPYLLGYLLQELVAIPILQRENSDTTVALAQGGAVPPVCPPTALTRCPASESALQNSREPLKLPASPSAERSRG